MEMPPLIKSGFAGFVFVSCGVGYYVLHRFRLPRREGPTGGREAPPPSRALPVEEAPKIYKGEAQTMKKLKKALSLTLALALSLSMAVPAFAAAPDPKHFSFGADPVGTCDYEDWDGPATLVILPDDSTSYMVTLEDCGLFYWDSGFFGGGIGCYGNLFNRLDPDDVDAAQVFENDGVQHIENNYNNVEQSSHWEKWGILTADEQILEQVTIMSEYAAKQYFSVWSGWEGADPDPMADAINKILSLASTTPTQPEQPVQPDAPGSYTVKKGDTWSSICTNFYGDNAQRYNLMKANKNVKLKAGTVITLPEKLGKYVLIPAPAAADGEKLYTVKAGDTLGKIAAAEYGKVSEYKAIFERNSDRLKNANLIYVGQVIVLPAKK